MENTLDIPIGKALKNILNLKKDIKVLIPKKKCITSCIYIIIENVTVRISSQEFIKSGIDVCVYSLKESEEISTDCFEQIFKDGKYSFSSIVAIISMSISKIQGFTVKGCNTSN